MSNTNIPPKEKLEEELFNKAHELECGQTEFKQIALMHAACLMSVKYMIDIRVFMWKVCGIKAGKYDGYLELFEKHGVGHYVTV